MTGPKIQVRDVRRFSGGRWSNSEPDQLTIEEPLEIRIADEPIAVIMRTPGDDEALARGFCVTEGIVSSPKEIAAIETPAANVIEIRLGENAGFDRARFARNFYATSSCGICGKASIEAITTRGRPIIADWSVAPELILDLPDRLRASQTVFERTGSLHAAGLFSLNGESIAAAEDVGRHNAVDKVIGAAIVTTGLGPNFRFDESILAVSGRISFEITQKAFVAGIPLIAAVSGASSLAVSLAEDQGMTLVGFIRKGSMTVYSGDRRIK